MLLVDFPFKILLIVIMLWGLVAFGRLIRLLAAISQSLQEIGHSLKTYKVTL